MPTLSSEQPASSPREPHQARQMAESFGVDTERYDRTRPCYPDALVRRVIAAAPGRDVLDVGCGTGIAARQFRAAGCTVLGVEPDARMAAFAWRTGIAAEVATFETWDPAGRTFDAVVAGQAWHWVDPVQGPARAAQVLRPGGLLAAFGHVFNAPPEVIAALTEGLKRVAPDSPLVRAHEGEAQDRSVMDVYQEMFARIRDGIRQAGGFAEPERWRFDWERSYTREEWLDLLPTTGGLTRLAPDALAEVLDHVGAAIDRLGGGFTVPYTTLAAVAERKVP